MDRTSLNNQGAQGTAAAPDSALACDIFDKFCNASTLKTILGYHRQLCDAINTRPNHFPAFYPKLKQYVNSWRAKALWKKFDLRASHKCYARGKACPNTRVLIVGGGPCGLRTAIEAQLLGAKVVVIEKRDRMSRNNVLHLWPFVIEDLRALGAKKFFGKFCAGAIDHISIRQIQCILLKVALLLGVEIHTEVSFMKLLPPPSKDESQERIGWRGMFCPADHPVSQYEFDVLIGADGRRNTLEGFKRKEFRGRLAIAITANFINKRTEAEARVEEISGVAFIFNQKFFKDLYEATGIDLENIVYYKDDTHYFVMTAKKQSLLEKGVIINDIPDTSKLLSRENVDVDALQNYAREAADFSTQYQMTDLEFAVNHYGNPDVNMFDFTSMYAAENASKVLDRHGHRLLMTLVGDSLLEPFWPTGSGCARGFLSSMDACWALRAWGSGTMTPLEVLAERESIYRLLGQTTPENLQRDSKSYTLDPSTRYPNLNKNSLLPTQVALLFDTDNPGSLEAMQSATPAAPQVQELHKKRRRKDSQVHPDTLLEWLKRQIVHYEELSVDDLTTSFKDGFVLCAVIHRYRPDLLDFHALKKDDVAPNNQLAFDILEKELGISPVMTGQEMEACAIPDLLTMLSYLTQIYDTFRGEIPHIKHPKLKSENQIDKLPILVITETSLPESSESNFFTELEALNFNTDCINNISQISVQSGSGLAFFQLNPKDTSINIQEKLKLDIDTTQKSATNSLESQTSKSFIETTPSSTEKSSNNETNKSITSSFETDTNEFDEDKLNFETIIYLNIDPPQDVIEIKNYQAPIAKPKYSKRNLKLKTCNKNVKLDPQKIKTNLITAKDFKHATKAKKKAEVKSKFRSTLIPKRRLSYNSFNLSVKRSICCIKDKRVELQKFNSRVYTRNKFHRRIKLKPAVINTNKEIQILHKCNDETFRDNESCATLIPNDLDSNSYENFFENNEAIDLEESKISNCLSNIPEETSEEIVHNVVSHPPEVPLEFLKNLIEPSERILQIIRKKSQLRYRYKQLDEKCSHLHQLIHKTSCHSAINLDLPEPKKIERLPVRDFTVPNRMNITANTAAQSRVSARHKRHAEIPNAVMVNLGLNDRKARKRRSQDKVGASVEERQVRMQEIISNRNERMSRRKQQRKQQTEQFIKSMQMLHANAKFDENCPFEDYSIYLYRQTAPNFEDRVKHLEQKLLFPDRDPKFPGKLRGEKDEEFSGRIKDFEDKLRETIPQEKKPKDLLRAIGKIETTDWNVREIEKKIIENKMGKSGNREKERVPKWSNEQFLARRTKMEKKGIDRQDSEDKKYAAIDKSLKQLDQKLKEGTVRELKQNKVSAITEQFKKQPEPEVAKPIQKSSSKVIIPAPGGSENCHFCAKRVYLMERLSAEGRFFHRGCFRCQYCSTMLRLGSYLFDRDGKYGHKFYCSQHFGMSGQLKGSKVVGKSKPGREHRRSPDKTREIGGADFIDRVNTPERIEFSNMSGTGGISDLEESVSQMDEDEWTDRNFGASTAEIGSSDESSESDSESEDDEVFEEALEEPITKEGTHRIAKEWVKRYSKDHELDDSDSPVDYDTGSDFSYESTSDDDESDTATEGEEEIRARELRKEEVRVKQPIIPADTGSDTELASDEETSASSSDKENSATDIPTDSEFDHDDRTPTSEIPAIMLNDMNITKTRGSGGQYYPVPKKVQVKSGELQRPQKSGDIELKFVPLKPTNAQKPTIGNPDLIKPSALVNPRKGDYLLNRTQSTGGIASKVSLELKKRYLLGNNGLAGNIQRSGSTTTLDSKFKSFNSKISEHQKLLNPAPEISPTMQAFLQGTSKIRVPLSPTLNPKSPTFPQKQIIDQNQKKPICTPENHIKTNQKALIFDPLITKFDHICVLNKAKSELKSPEIIDLTLSPNDKFAMQPDITKDLLPEDTKTETYESPQILEEPSKPDIIFNEVESRPRSPVHETSIIVPEIPWVTNKKTSEIDSDSLSSSESDMVADKSIGKVFSDIPRVQVHDTSGELLQDDDIVMDSLCIIPDLPEDKISISEVPKSIQSEKKKLNQPKLLPGLEGLECAELTKTLLENKTEGSKTNLEGSEPRGSNSDESGLPKFLLGAETINFGTKLDQSGLPKFILGTKFDDGLQNANVDDDKSSGRNTPISESDSICNDLTTAALTETELSDWARDGAVSDNLDDVEFDINPQSKSNKRLKSKKKRSDARIAMGEDFEDTGHICGKKLIAKSPERLPNGAPIADLDSIEYMDTGSEVSLEENCVETTNSGLLKNRGYIHFVNEVETVKHKPIEVINNNEPVEAVNKNVLLPLSSADQNTGYCVYGNENENQVIEVIKDDKAVLDNNDDAVEAGTTTEETTISDSTVKNMISEPKVDTPEIINDETIQTPVIEGVEYDEHVKRLQSKYAEFGYVRDSIDIRKSKRKSLSPPTTESSPTGVTSPSFSSPATSRKLEEINKARSKQHDLIRDLVLDKVKLSKKPDKKRRIRESYSPSCSPVRRNFELTKSATVDITPIPRKLSPQLTDYTSKPVDLTQSDDLRPKSINLPNLTNMSPKSSNITPILTNIYSNSVNVTPNLDIITPKSVNTSKTVNSTSKSVNIISKSVDGPLSKSPLTDFSPSIGFVPKSLDFNSKSPQILRTESLRTSEKLYPIQRSPTISGVPLEKENLFPNHRTEFYTPVTSLKDLNPKTLARPLSMHGSFIVSTKPLTSPNYETLDTFSLPDFENMDDFKTPRAPPRFKHEEAKKTAEKLKHDARTRARLMSDEDLGLSPEDKLNFHRQIAGKLKKTSIDESIQESIESLVKNTEKRNAMLLSDTLNQPQLKQKSFSDIPTKLSLYKSEDNIERTKSVSEICKTLNQSQSFAEDQLKMSHSTTQINKTDTDKSQFYKSDPNLLTETGKKEKKPKDRDRRKSIIKSMTEFFQKKKDSKSPNSSNSSGSVKDRFSRFRISPKSKDKSKDQNLEAVPVRSKSLCENSVKGNVSPPPIPPPPLNYSGNSTRDNSGSDGDCDWKKLNNSSDNLDQSCAIDGSGNSLGRRRCSRSLRKASKQAQIKRHRLAQEIQRKLEETEVKTRELEQRGVNVEKALRGEATTDDSSQREEEDLLREWFDLMRDRTELRRYEKELLVRAQELELEDRHARLQQELRDRLAGDDERKTQEDVAAEGAILSEMLEIVAKRDSLVAILEEDRQRYHEENRDFEAQMLAKGLHLTPIKKTPD